MFSKARAAYYPQISGVGRAFFLSTSASGSGEELLCIGHGWPWFR